MTASTTLYLAGRWVTFEGKTTEEQLVAAFRMGQATAFRSAVARRAKRRASAPATRGAA